MRFIYSIALITHILTSTALAQDSVSTIAVVIETFNQVPSVNAEVSIENGAIITSNCDELTNSNNDSLTYRLELVDQVYQCVPNKSQLSVFETINVDLGFQVNADNLKESLHDYGKTYEEDSGSKNSIFSIETDNPVCQISDGTIDYSTCACPTTELSFNSDSKLCEGAQSFVAYYINTCGVGMGDTIDFFGESIYPKSNVSLGICTVAAEKYKVAYHKLVMKILYFSYFKKNFIEALSQNRRVEDLKLYITQEEISELKQWLETPSALNSLSEQAVNVIKNDLDYMLEVRFRYLIQLETKE